MQFLTTGTREHEQALRDRTPLYETVGSTTVVGTAHLQLLHQDSPQTLRYVTALATARHVLLEGERDVLLQLPTYEGLAAQHPDVSFLEENVDLRLCARKYKFPEDRLALYVALDFVNMLHSANTPIARYPELIKKRLLMRAGTDFLMPEIDCAMQTLARLYDMDEGLQLTCAAGPIYQLYFSQVRDREYLCPGVLANHNAQPTLCVVGVHHVDNIVRVLRGEQLPVLPRWPDAIDSSDGAARAVIETVEHAASKC